MNNTKESKEFQELPPSFFSEEEIYNQTRLYQAHMAVENPEKNFFGRPKKQTGNERIVYNNNRKKHQKQPKYKKTGGNTLSVVAIILGALSFSTPITILGIFGLLISIIAFTHIGSKLLAFLALLLNLISCLYLFIILGLLAAITSLT